MTRTTMPIMGASIAMLPGELHEAAFRRYCEQEHRSKYQRYRVKFIGSAPAAPIDAAGEKLP